MVNFLYPRRCREAEPLWLFPSPHGARAEDGIEAENPDFEHGGGVAMRGRLNAFFAISVNSPSMSMVNFSCCVCSAPKVRAWRNTKVAPQPMRAVVRTEAGADAGI